MRSRYHAVFVAVVGLSALCGCSKDNQIEANQTTNVCDDNTMDCVPCDAGEYKCDGATLKICQADGQGFDAITVCVSEALCVLGLPQKACAAPVCNPADTRCVGATMWVCAPGQDALVDTECPSVESCTAGLNDEKCAAGECATPADCTGVETECRKRSCEAGFCGFTNLPTDTPCETNRVCDGEGNCVGQCNLPTDCSGQDTECRKRTCEAGVCGFADSLAGTVVAAQTQGDCKRQVCDGEGGTTNAPDPADVPDDGNDCTIEGCDGINPTTDWEVAGASCNAGGVCNGAGLCGVCVPSAKQCSGAIPQTCNASGQWESGAACTNLCTAGDCTGSCQPGTKTCNGTTPQTCGSGGQWIDGAPCPYVCTAGNCTGVCVPGTASCKDLRTKQRCGATGHWADDGTCSSTTPFCIDNGKCGCPGTAGPPMLGVPGGFCIDTTEVTIQQYKAWLDSNPSTAGQPSYCSWNTTFTPDSWSTQQQESWDHPVRWLDWCDARAYCAAAGKRLCGKIGGGSNDYNQPNLASNSQWHAACTSGGLHTYTYGNVYDTNACWHGSDWVAVGSMATCQSPEPAYQGIFDLSGNVMEWEDACNQYVGSNDACHVRGSYFQTQQGKCEASSITASKRNIKSANGIRCCSDP